MNTDTELAARLKAWRDEAGISKRAAAQVLGIPKRTLDGIEQGRPFRYEQMLKLAIQAVEDMAA